jgi:hypothetical protein
MKQLYGEFMIIAQVLLEYKVPFNMELLFLYRGLTYWRNINKDIEGTSVFEFGVPLFYIIYKVCKLNNEYIL